MNKPLPFDVPRGTIIPDGGFSNEPGARMSQLLTIGLEALREFEPQSAAGHEFAAALNAHFTSAIMSIGCRDDCNYAHVRFAGNAFANMATLLDAYLGNYGFREGGREAESLAAVAFKHPHLRPLIYRFRWAIGKMSSLVDELMTASELELLDLEFDGQAAVRFQAGRLTAELLK